MNYTYHLPLVIISALIAVLASYTALEMAAKVKNSNDNSWLIGSAIAMGTGIWSMHFVAMLAFSLPVKISYNLLLVVISLLAAIAASFQAFFIVSRPTINPVMLIAGAASMGIGIASMHYIGMAAMKMQAITHYNPPLFFLSVGIAVVVSLVALFLFLKFGAVGRRVNKKLQLITAIVMGAGVSSMHYTGMAAAIFEPDYEQYVAPALIDNVSLAFLVATSTFLVLGAALAIANDKPQQKYSRPL
ncbi:MAG: signal protein [Aphanothece sp. CMT-3BRIN-NPC111]|nr:signal protein [Aphanothece sp. CMT-3BRIN-NPC111]